VSVTGQPTARPGRLEEECRSWRATTPAATMTAAASVPQPARPRRKGSTRSRELRGEEEQHSDRDRASDPRGPPRRVAAPGPRIRRFQASRRASAAASLAVRPATAPTHEPRRARRQRERPSDVRRHPVQPRLHGVRRCVVAASAAAQIDPGRASRSASKAPRGRPAESGRRAPGSGLRTPPRPRSRSLARVVPAVRPRSTT